MKKTKLLSLPLSALLLAATLLVAGFSPPPVHAAELAGVELADQATAGDETLVLNGLGLRKKFFVKVYVGGLYLPQKTSDAQALLDADAPRHMVMEFLREVDAESLVGAWDDCLEANTPNASSATKQDFDTLNGWMTEVDEGDRLTFTYLPDEGTKVAVKGTEKGVIEGKPFADALFACWIGPEPPSDDFKEGLLGE